MMGTTINPVVYMPTNTSNVIEGGRNTNSSVSTHPVVAAAVTILPAWQALPKLLALLLVPHLFWHCSTSGDTDMLPVTFEALMFPGSYIVLISELFAQLLELKCRKLLDLLPIKMAVPDKKHKIITVLTKWVKHRLYEPSGSWITRTVCAVIAPSLCVHVILGTPFLSHNKIVVDHTTCTAVDKIFQIQSLEP